MRAAARRCRQAAPTCCWCQRSIARRASVVRQRKPLTTANWIERHSSATRSSVPQRSSAAGSNASSRWIGALSLCSGPAVDSSSEKNLRNTPLTNALGRLELSVKLKGGRWSGKVLNYEWPYFCQYLKRFIFHFTCI